MSLRPAPKHAPRVPFVLLVLGLLVGGLVALLALNTASAANELSRRDLATKDAVIAAQLEQLNQDVAASEAPGNLARIAAQFGMVPAGHPAFLQIDPNGRVQLLGSPAPASAPPIPAPIKPTVTAPVTPPVKPPVTAPKTAPKTTPTATPTAKKTPIPTPNPTTTLPGGTR